MSICATCINWRLQDTPAWAQFIALAYCSDKRTKAVTMAHWSSCDAYRAAPPADLEERRALWRQVVSPTGYPPPRVGSFPSTPIAGHSRREVGLFHGAAKGVVP